MNHKEIMDGIHLAEETLQWQALVETVIDCADTEM
jgi:hypothetical protein